MCSQSEFQEQELDTPCQCKKMAGTGEKSDSTDELPGSVVKYRRSQSVAECMSFLARKLDALRMEHFQACAVAVVTCFATLQLFPLLTRSSHVQVSAALGADDNSPPGVANGMLHLGSFGANFGAQMWVTFVAGLTMFYSLPRHMFGKVQSRLFPMFFLWSLFFSAVTLSTFLERHPYDSWNSELSLKGVILFICFVTAAINSLMLSPAIVSAMLKTFKKEVDAGAADVIGHANVVELKKDPEYIRTYRTFRRLHALSAILVVTSLVCNTVYLYHLSSQCTVAL